MAFVLDAACGSNIGKLRTNNEDNCYFNDEILPENNTGIQVPWRCRSRAKTVCFGVFDGMGGHDDGQVASFLAAKSFACGCRRIEPEDALSEAFFSSSVSDMNDAVFAEAERRMNNMGTTAVMIGFCHDTVFLCNVGDSRAYRLRNGQLAQISMDHVVTFSVPARGGPYKKTMLSQCIGISPEELILEPHFMHDALRAGDQYLLCSDGLTDMVPTDCIQLILEESSDAGDAVQELIEWALDSGGRDNVTVLLIKAAAEP